MKDEDDEVFGQLTLNGKPLFESAWLKAADLNGRDTPVTIETVERAEVFNKKTNKKEPKVALMFEGKKKGVICNKTNAASIAKATGEGEALNWVGRQVVLYPTTCRVGRGTQNCIRVRETAQPKQNGRQEPPAAPAHPLAQPLDALKQKWWTAKKAELKGLSTDQIEEAFATWVQESSDGAVLDTDAINPACYTQDVLDHLNEVLG